MEIAVSNIAWEPSQLSEHLNLLQQLDCKGIEISPSSIWDEPVLTSKKERADLLNLVNKHGLEIVSLHSLTYTHPELKMFSSEESREKLKLYLFELIELAHDLKCPIMIFGSPQSRKVGDNDYGKCFRIAIDFFTEIGLKAKLNGVTFCIEPLGPSDNCDFITTADEANELIKQVDVTNFSLHLDAKAMMDVNEEYQKVFDNYGSILKHFHVGDPELKPPGTVTNEHVKIANALKRSNYNGYVSIEMKKGMNPSKKVIKNAVEYVRKIYSINCE